MSNWQRMVVRTLLIMFVVLPFISLVLWDSYLFSTSYIGPATGPVICGRTIGFYHCVHVTQQAADTHIWLLRYLAAAIIPLLFVMLLRHRQKINREADKWRRHP